MKNYLRIFCTNSSLPYSPEKLSDNYWQKSIYKNVVRAIAFTVFVLCFGHKLSAQLGAYKFEGITSCPNPNINVEIQPSNAVFGVFSSVGTSCIASDTSFTNSDWNTSGTLDGTRYNEFTITPATGYLLTLGSLSFDHWVSIDNTPAATWHLRSGIDNFASDIASGTTNTSLENTLVTLPANAFANVGAVTFRLYLTDIVSSGDSWSIDNVTLNGAVNMIPASPPSPTSNSPQCNMPGVLIARTGTPPADETWYWQTSATGTDRTNHGNTHTATISGTYYLRAQNNTSQLWSDGAASVSVIISQNVDAPVFSLGNTSKRCQAAETITYTASANNATGITYSIDAASIAGGNSIDVNTGTVTYAAGWSGTTVITASASGCNGPVMSTHTVTTTASVDALVFSLGNTSKRCQAAETITYTASANNATGITYSIDAASIAGGNSIDVNTGIVTFAVGWSGTTVITASASGCTGPVMSTHTVTTTASVDAPVFSLGNTSKRCQAAETITYTASANNATGITYSIDAASIAGGNSIDVNTGIVTFAAGWSGTTVITASASGCNGPVMSTHTVTINGLVLVPIFSIGNTSSRCQGNNAVLYTATANNATSIVYTIDTGSLSSGNTIDAASGNVTYATGWSGTTTITATAAGCSGPLNAMHTAVTIPSVSTPLFTLGSASVRCQGAATVNYNASAANSTGITYSLDATSLAGGNTISPPTGDVTYASGWNGTTTVTASAAGCNGPKFSTHTVTTTPTVGIPVFASGSASTRCQGAGAVTYTASASSNAGISYALDAASLAAGNSINTITGTVTFIATWSGTSIVTASAAGCNGPSSSAHTINITPTVSAPIFSSGPTSVRCQGAGVVSYVASAANSTSVTYSLNAASVSGGNSINAATGVVTYVAGWSGTSVITANATGCNGPISATHTVTITPTVGTPVFALGSSSIRCQGAGSVNYNASATNNTGITWSLDAASISAGNTINSATGQVSYVAGWAGTSTIAASADGCNGPKVSIHTVTTTPTVGVPVFTLGSISTRCQGAGTVVYAATATNTTGMTYSLDGASVAGGNAINASTGTITYSAGWSGTTTVTANAAGCNGPAIATHTITITPSVSSPVFDLGSTSVRCQGSGTVNYSASAANTIGITYALNAASITGGNTISAATGDVTFASTWSGTTIITASAIGCNGPKTSTHTVTITPTVGTPVFTAGASSTRCQGGTTVTYTSSATNNTGITYTLDAASITAGNTINASTGAVTYASTWNGTSTITATATGCNGPKTNVHTITTTPTVSAPVFTLSSASTRCQGPGSVTYSATAANSTAITYSLDIISLLFGNSINSSTGTVTYLAGWSGNTTITASAAGCNGPVTSTHIATVTATVGAPIFALGSSSSRCQNAEVVSYAASSSNSTSITYSLDAASRAAGNTIDPASGSVTYLVGWVGTSVITATATGCNGPKSSTHTVTNNPSVTIPVFAMGATSTICQGSGKITYTATANNTSGITYSLDAASTAAGNFIKNNGQVTYQNTWSGTTVITASAAGCNGPLTATHTVTITPFVGNPVFTSGNTSVRCQGAGTVTYVATATDAASMTYTLDNLSKNAGNTINATTGAVTYTAGWTGSSVITVTASGCNGITTATHTVTITPTVGTPVFVLGVSSSRCQGGNTVSYTATASNSVLVTYSLDATSIANGSSINGSTGAVTYAAGWVGTTVITATASGCNGPKTSVHTVIINPSVTTPYFLAGTSTTRCQGVSTITYTATAANTTGLTYSPGRCKYSGGCTILPSTGAVTFSAAWSGMSVVTVSATGCNGPKTATHTITITPNGTPFFIPAASTRCQGAGNVTYTGSAANNSGVTYSLDAASINGGNSINAATGVVTYAATWTGATIITATATGCAGSVSAAHTVTITPNGTPAFTLGPVSSRLQGAGTVIYKATSNNGAPVTYSLDAASIAGGNTINASTGAVTFAAAWSNTTIVTASATGCNGVATATHTISINSAVVTKSLYLSDPSQSLDRIDPVNTNDLSTANTAPLGGGRSYWFYNS